MSFKRRPQVKIYTMPGVVMCDLTKDYFRESGIDFDEIDASPGTDGEKELFETSGDNKTPTVDFDGRIIIGYQPDIYTILLKENENQEKERASAKEEQPDLS